MNAIIGNMKDTIDSKEAEIEELKSRLLRSGSASTNAASNNDISLLTHALKEREDEIDNLQDKLAQATK